MTDERDDREGEVEPPEEEPKGLGLTEEFARLEREIEREVGRSTGSREEAAEEPEPQPDPDPAPAADAEPDDVDEAAREVRFDEDDSTEWVAPVRSGPETDEWAEEGSEEEDGVEAAEPADPEPTEVHAAPGADDADHAEDAEGADGVEEPESTPPPAPADAPATEHTIVRPGPMPQRTPASVASGAGGGGAPIPPLAIEGDMKDRTPALWWRFLTASVVIVAATATAVSVNILLFFGDLAKGLNDFGDRVDRQIDQVDPGEPQTILILGSDKRSNTPGDPGRSDTTMLLRVDADDEVLSLFSLPRDLKVEIPGYGTGKLNEAYTVGGVSKTAETVKELLDIKINHIVNVDFQGFADAVDAIDCVYVDVDRDYFNDNSGLYGEQTYAAIDVNAGYQRLCGQNALDYVRYRHTDTDLVRAARQQDFLAQARRQVPVGEVLPILGGDLGSDLLDIFTKYTTSDIDSTEGVLSTLKAFIGVRNVPVQRVSFDGTLGESYVTATQEQLEKATDEFLNGEDTAGPTGEPESDKSKKGGSKKGDGGGDEKAEKAEKAELISGADASAACGEGLDKFEAFGRTSARRLKFPVYVPTAVVPGSCYDDGSRQYDITDPDEETHDAYKMVIEYTTPSTLPEYYGVMGTTWGEPPILDDPSDTIEIGDRSYDLYYDGDRLQRVAWHDSENNSYWLSNTLLGTLDEGDMLAIAKSMEEANAK